MFGPFWWLAPIEYGFHRSKSTQRPSRPPHTRLIVRLRGGAAGCAVARPIGVSAATAVAAAAPCMTLRRLVLWLDIGCFLSPRRSGGLCTRLDLDQGKPWDRFASVRSTQMAGHRVRGSNLPQHRRLAPAALLGVDAAGVEMAARGRRDRARHIAGQQALHPGIRNWYCGEQRLGVGVQRPGEQRLLVGALDDPAEIHDRDAMADVL